MDTEAVVRRVKVAAEHLLRDEFENGFIQICPAVEPVARAEGFAGGSGEVFKKWFESNQELFTRAAFGGTSVGGESFRMRLDYEPLRKLKKDGLSSLAEVMYHAVRCALAHEAGLPSNLRFINQLTIRAQDGALELPRTFAWALCVLVVTSPALASVDANVNMAFRIRNAELPSVCLWGRRDEVLWLLRSLKASREPEHGKPDIFDGTGDCDGSDCNP
jgi:hypothetical protein